VRARDVDPGSGSRSARSVSNALPATREGSVLTCVKSYCAYSDMVKSFDSFWGFRSSEVVRVVRSMSLCGINPSVFDLRSVDSPSNPLEITFNVIERKVVVFSHKRILKARRRVSQLWCRYTDRVKRSR
jgi:hypothetical protein